MGEVGGGGIGEGRTGSSGDPIGGRSLGSGAEGRLVIDDPQVDLVTKADPSPERSKRGLDGWKVKGLDRILRMERMREGDLLGRG